ncbi:NACHT domain-containing protein [uncultured Chryseobacterium sp.]|uniref:NACHT domain-containing protein n=1 Tax=uncultured Chryseobacterium sp. TaxID=259322 RepID=UPI003749779C
MEIKLNCSKYLLNINKKEVIKNLFDFNIGSTLTEIIDIQKNVEMKAFLLLFNSARNTNEQLSRYYGQEQINKTYNLASISRSLLKEYKNFLEQEITIKKDFFYNIIHSDNKYLIGSFNLFQKFCKQLEINLPKDIRVEYYIGFRENLNEEFENHKERYQELIDFFNNPISVQNEVLYNLFDYFSSYKEFYTRTLQEESITKERLKDLYIEPYFSIHKNNILNNSDSNKDFYPIFEGLTIHEFFNNYFLANKKHDFIKKNYDMAFVLGQPGQGKTSFCYKLLYDYLERYSDLPPLPIVFIKIRDLVAKDFINDPFKIIEEHHHFISFKNDEVILVLDGLDESYMSGGITNEDLRNLYERLKKRNNKKIKIILTSRFNFLNVNDSCLDNTLILQLNELTDHQIKEYCRKFKIFYPENSLTKNINSILGTKKYEHIKELLRQAVLIYFIAIADIEIEEKDSKSKIYDKIFDSLAQRSWDSNGQLDYINPKLKSDPDLYKSYLREYIRNIAFEIYHSPKLYITISKLLELDATKLFIKRCFNDALNDTKDRIKEFSKYLLISFYFQQTNQDSSDTALEFFHNSLWEFLTAEYMWEENKNLLLKKDRYDELETIRKENYFSFLDKLSGQKKINEFYVAKNLVEIISNEEEITKIQIFNQSIEIFYELLNNDFLLNFNFEKEGLTCRKSS